MGGIVVNGEKLEIRQFKNVFWIRMNGFETLPEILKEMHGIQQNISKNGCWYISDNTDCILYAFWGNIGKDEHPLIEKPSVSVWYSSNLGGVYIVGKDKKTGAFFAPVVN